MRKGLVIFSLEFCYWSMRVHYEFQFYAVLKAINRLLPILKLRQVEGMRSRLRLRFSALVASLVFSCFPVFATSLKAARHFFEEIFKFCFYVFQNSVCF